MENINPFEFGRAVTGRRLVDRESEVGAVVSAMRNGGRLFLIGPRRFGKTSILRAASETASESGVVVLGHDAEAYPSVRLLSEALISDAARQLTSTIERAGEKLRDFLSRLRPQMSIDPLENKFRVTLTTEPGDPDTRFLTDVLDGIDRLASDARQRACVVIDEFQTIIEREQSGLEAERQIRAAVQRHDHLAYVFAGSKTAMLTEMTGDASRPFYRLGERLFVGPIPRSDFADFIHRSFRDTGLQIDAEAIEEILDSAQDVPYNVQRLAHACWNAVKVQEASQHSLKREEVEAILNDLVRRDDPFYTQLWNRLTSPQQKALLAVVERQGQGLYSRAVLEMYELPLSTMRRSVQSLVAQGILREVESMGSVELRLEDPFFGVWLATFTSGV